MESFIPILILLIFALGLCAGIFILTNLLGPRVLSDKKLSPYECGVAPEDDARTPFEIKFYTIAVLFLLFDIEAAFFFPWALVYRESLATDSTLFGAMIAYLFFLVLALVYVYRKNFLGIKQ